ncbi:DgyrCDS5306 [Dimorphilus gyrociliatus]|uniref:Acetyltransferase component of pyruvate dehydrogenase complex n=1 Tax=Dimorphilus gyrociliatus TaxID=2664684 RepID=A0A7I8VJL9_9ANNE|nr:DgyrCDS5306 [Dimorphilus gyrociliatus]
MHRSNNIIRPLINSTRKSRYLIRGRSHFARSSIVVAAVDSKIINLAPKKTYEQTCFERIQKRLYSNDTLPPHFKVNLPALSPTMEMGSIVSWSKKEGDSISEGDLLTEIETDKATMGLETPEEGYLAKIFIPSGVRDVPVGKLLCIIVPDESSLEAFKNYTAEDLEGDSQAPDATTADTSAENSETSATSANYPNHMKVELPALSPTMETGTLTSWSKEVGDELSEGDVLAQIETDKATMEFETPHEGYLAKILIESGTKDVKLGEILCIIVENKDDIDAFKDYTTPSKSKKQPQSSKPFTVSQTSSPPVSSFQEQAQKYAPPKTQASISPTPRTGERIFVSPYAKKLAAEKSIDLRTVQGTGPAGRIIAQDIINYQPSSPSAYPHTISAAPGVDSIDIPLSNMRKTIAKRLIQSKTTIPHYYLSRTITLDAIMQARKDINSHLESSGNKVSLNDMIIKAVAFACKQVPEANSAWHDTFIRRHNRVDVSVAVATPEGLITPIVFAACTKSVADIANNVRELANKAKENKLVPEEYQGGTITVSNLGMFGITNFSAIINPPQSCILAVGSGVKAVVPADNDKGYKTVQQMQVTLSCDHRVVDGAIGAQWLDAFSKAIEKPSLLLI